MMILYEPDVAFPDTVDMAFVLLYSKMLYNFTNLHTKKINLVL